ncbi:unnamed protein product [Periconia digitata]|uniref:Aminoglycoside phosphotransferase domain-containing protein n=1 Tax=Periconia digitata TaxID=1303443 RepID=A0A9W4UBX1_9PLEO|nr:unnamed protein product [Periconia digitata]
MSLQPQTADAITTSPPLSDQTMATSDDPISEVDPAHERSEHEDSDDQMDDDDAASETSTVAYEHLDHEPWETFQHKVAQLAHSIFPEASKIDIERMKGGSFNRVVGVTVHARTQNIFARLVGCFKRRFYSKKLNVAKKYVLRIARDIEDSDVEQEVAVLNMLAAKLSLPTSKVFKYDTSTDNVLEKPYMIQTRLEGQLLSDIGKDLNLKQWESVIKNIISLNDQITAFESSSSGEIAKDNISATPQSAVSIDKFHVPRKGMTSREFTKPSTWPSQPQSVMSSMLEQCERWREYQNSKGSNWDHIWDGFSAIIRSLDERGFLDGSFSLAHGDFKGYNMLCTIQNESTVEITGVIDWDFAMFVPKFLAFRGPFWLWLDDGTPSHVYDLEGSATIEPTGERECALKSIFMAGASDEWKKFAFAPEAILARRMFVILKDGIFGPWAVDEVAAIIQEWIALHPEDNIPVEETHSSDEEMSDDEMSDEEESDDEQDSDEESDDE